MIEQKKGEVSMRCSCQQKNKVKRMLAIALGAAVLAVLFYCVPWWVFLIIGVLALALAGWRLLSD
jgi:hypothetical protein